MAGHNEAWFGRRIGVYLFKALGKIGRQRKDSQDRDICEGQGDQGSERCACGRSEGNCRSCASNAEAAKLKKQLRDTLKPVCPHKVAAVAAGILSKIGEN